MRQPGAPIRPALPKALLDQVQGSQTDRKKPQISRQQTRKADRQNKKQLQTQSRTRTTGARPQRYPVSRATDLSAKKPLVAASPETTSTLKDPNTSAKDKPQRAPNESPHDPAPQQLSKSARDALARDDAEIARFEKKLGIRGKKRKAAQDQDTFDSLLDEIGQGGDSDTDHDAELQSWLQQKRRRVETATTSSAATQAQEYDNDSSRDHDPFNEFSDESFNAHHSDQESDDSQNVAKSTPPKRENPYRAPTTATDNVHAKYIPPSLRVADDSQSESLQRLKRQIKGQVNRLTEANMLSIVQTIEQCFQDNARHHVTSSLVDLVVGLICDPSILTDSFIILHAGFVAALYRIIGVDFGAHIVERVVQDLSARLENNDFSGKQASNLMSFISNLYNFDVVACPIIYDYIRLLIQHLSEDRTEVLLRMLRHSGPHLRQDDPSALKDIVKQVHGLAQKATGTEIFSIRQQYMVETLDDLKNNRSRHGNGPSSVVTEHITKMRKTLGTLKARQLRANEPLRITLSDLASADKKGKWWLIGASYNDPQKVPQQPALEKHTMPVSDDPTIDYLSLAREQRMNTDVRRAIFVSIMSATDYEDAYTRLVKLNLKKAQRLEIPRVLVHCAAAEKRYNHYYTLIANRVLVNEPKLTSAFQFCLWDLFKRMQGESSSSDDDEESEVKAHEMLNLSRLFGFLLARLHVSITALKKLNLAYPLRPPTTNFLEALLTHTVIQCERDGPRNDAIASSASLERVFGAAHNVPEMVPGLVIFLEKVVCRSDMLDHSGSRERGIVERGSRIAIEVLKSRPATSL